MASERMGLGAAQLSFPIVSLHIDFPAASHPEMASDTNDFARLFLTDYCKALSRAFCFYCDFHMYNDMSKRIFESKERLSSTPSVFYQKTGHSFLSKINTLLTRTRACLLSIHLYHNKQCKVKVILEITKNLDPIFRPKNQNCNATRAAKGYRRLTGRL